jgi:hypothetical protein
MRFILVQEILEKQEVKGATMHNFWNTIVRSVEAENKEVAIGRFVIATQSIKAKEKLDVQCYPLEDLIKL